MATGVVKTNRNNNISAPEVSAKDNPAPIHSNGHANHNVNHNAEDSKEFKEPKAKPSLPPNVIIPRNSSANPTTACSPAADWRFAEFQSTPQYQAIQAIQAQHLQQQSQINNTLPASTTNSPISNGNNNLNRMNSAQRDYFTRSYQYLQQHEGKERSEAKEGRIRARSRPPHSALEGDTKAGTKVWRLRERMRVVSAALIMCLNLGVDPPDIVKPSPCARMECWLHPDQLQPSTALKTIGAKLQSQYEQWQEKAKYRILLDPIADEVRRLCLNLRRIAGEERVLFHYNGHGVPRPTVNGEIWVYNRGYTQYIPVSLYDVQTWLNPDQPSIYVIDCSAAGLVIQTFKHFMKQRKEKQQSAIATATATPNSASNIANLATSTSNISSSSTTPTMNRASSPPASDIAAAEANLNADSAAEDDCRHIMLAACAWDELLPVTADLPADLFTACLTTPIKMALRWHVSRSSSLSQILTPEMLDRLPGIKKPNNRKQAFGELNWIFTAITDSIAWNILPRPMFQKLFRQDLLVASLFRNFLLAQRIFHTFNCSVQSQPALPNNIHLHPMWASWDYCVDICLAQLIRFEQNNVPFQISTFFEEQLNSFEIWLEFGSEGQLVPIQLPIVLQVLLSTDHRLRALQLLARYIDKGQFAVTTALQVGIFPYVLKLLQSPAKELKEVLIYIWAKILATDKQVQVDLSKQEHCNYFINHLLKYKPPTIPHGFVYLTSQQQQALASQQQSLAQQLSSSNSSTPTTRGLSSKSTPIDQPTETPNSNQLNQLLLARTSSNQSSSDNSEIALLTALKQANRNNQTIIPIGTIDEESLNSEAASNKATTGTEQPRRASNILESMRASNSPSNANHNAALANLNASRRSTQLDESKSNTSVAAESHPVVDRKGSYSSKLVVSIKPIYTGSPPQTVLSSPGNTGFTPLISPAAIIQSNTAGLSGNTLQINSNSLTGRSPAMLAMQLALNQTQLDSNGKLNAFIPNEGHSLTRAASINLCNSELQFFASAFILAIVVDNNIKAQQLIISNHSAATNLLSLLIPHLQSSNVDLRVWTCLLMGKLWFGYDACKQRAMQEGVLEVLASALFDNNSQVRAAVCYSIGCYFGGSSHSLRSDLELQLGYIVSTLVNDASPAVRKEMILALAELVYYYRSIFITLASSSNSGIVQKSSSSANSIINASSKKCYFIWRCILRCCRDPHPAVSDAALKIRSWLKSNAIFQNQLGRMIQSQHTPGLTLTLPSSSSSFLSSGQTHSATSSLSDNPNSPNIEPANDTKAENKANNSAVNNNNPVQVVSVKPKMAFPTSSVLALQSPPTPAANSALVSQDLLHTQATAAAATSNRPANPAAIRPAALQQVVQAADSSPSETSQLPLIHQPPLRPVHPPLRHFDRYKMSHMRQHLQPNQLIPSTQPSNTINNNPSDADSVSAAAAGNLDSNSYKSQVNSITAATSSAGLHREEKKQSINSSPTESSAAVTSSGAALAVAGEVDERLNDAMWQVPKSTLFQEQYEEFSNKAMLIPTAADYNDSKLPSSVELRENRWKTARQNRLLATARRLGSYDEWRESNKNWVETAFIDTEFEQVAAVHLHSFDNLLYGADNKSTIAVWNYGYENELQEASHNKKNTNTAADMAANNSNFKQEKVNSFNNENTRGSKINRLQIINEFSNNSLLMAASDDGVVRIWDKVQQEGQQKLITAWQVCTPLEFAFPALQLYQMQQNKLHNLRGGISPNPAASSLARSVSPSSSPKQMTWSSASNSNAATTPANASSHSITAMAPNFNLGPSAVSAAVNNAANTSPLISGITSNSFSSTATSTTSFQPSRRRHRPALVIDWNGSRGRISASGAGMMESIRIWDVSAEKCISELNILTKAELENREVAAGIVTATASNNLSSPVASASAANIMNQVNSLVTDHTGDLLFAGCLDGSVRLFDSRTGHNRVSIFRFHHNNNSVQHIQLTHPYTVQSHAKLISAASNGEIILSDLRMTAESIVKLHRPAHRESSNSLLRCVGHNYAPLLASSNSNLQKPLLELFDYSNRTIESIRYHIGFLGQRIDCVSSMDFHKHKLILAAGFMDSYISLFTAEK
jgi:hypothetical protein